MKEKKIGMCTFYDDNFGTCLQAYGLQKKISDLGYRVEIIQYNRDIKDNHSFVEKILSKKPKQLISALILKKRANLWKKGFNKFRESKLVFSEKKFNRNSNLKTLNNDYDLFVCGSDMIWSEEFREDWDFLYLTFVDNEKTIAYAPSFGKNQISEENQNICKMNLSRINKLSCREDAGVDLIKKNFQINNCIQVLDPTLLLTKEEWLDVIDDSNQFISEPYVLTYLFGGIKKDRKLIIKKVCSECKCRVLHIPMTKDEYNKDAFKGIMGPLEFLKAFRDATYIITDTFHGTIFSIIFQKQFIVLDRNDKSKWAKYSDRMTSTLEMFNLKNRYIYNNLTDDVLKQKIDYESIGEIMFDKRNQSLKFLKESLEK